MESVLRLPHLNALFLLQVIGAQGAVGAARMDPLRLRCVRENSNDIFLLVIELN